MEKLRLSESYNSKEGTYYEACTNFDSILMRSEEMRFSRKRIINTIISSNSDSDIDMQ